MPVTLEWPTGTDVQIRPAVIALAAGAGLSSGAALAISIIADRPLWLASTFVFFPGLVAFAGMSVIAGRSRQELFLERLRAGLISGALATACYDISRWVVEAPGLVNSDTFRAIAIFGTGLTGFPPDTAPAIAAGWAFHICNGLGFAVAYMFVAAGRRWPWGVAYALALESAMVALYPGWLGFSLTTEFLSVSILGHLAYGTVLGVAAERQR